MRSPFRMRSPVPLAPARGGNIMSLLRGGNKDSTPEIDAYGSTGVLFAMVSRLASATSKADWTLYRSAKSGLKEDRVPVTSHAMIDLWNQPNPFMHRRRFMEAAEQHVDLLGESRIIASHAQIGKNAVPIELWYVMPKRITPVPDPYEFLAGYVYTSPDGEKIPLETNECSVIMMPDPGNPYRGMGPVQSVMRDIDSARYSTEWNARFFENSAEPGGVLEAPETLEDAAFDRLKAQWSENHQGVAKAHRVAILEAGVTWNGTTISQKDMQFVELSQLSDEKVRQAFGYPKPMLGGVDDVNRANAEAGEYVFAKWLVEDRLDRWRDWLNFEILPQYGSTGEGLEWDYESPVPENSDQNNAAITARSTAAVALTGAGFDAAGVLAYLDMPELKYEKPEPPTIVAPPNSGQKKDDNGKALDSGGGK